MEYITQIDSIKGDQIIFKHPVKNQNNKYINYYKLLYSDPNVHLKYLLIPISFNEFDSFGFLPLIVGLVTTFISSLFAIDFLLKYFSSNGLKIFIIYRLVFGVLILLN